MWLCPLTTRSTLYLSNSGTQALRTPPSEAWLLVVEYAQWWKNTMTKSTSGWLRGDAAQRGRPGPRLRAARHLQQRYRQRHRLARGPGAAHRPVHAHGRPDRAA